MLRYTTGASLRGGLRNDMLGLKGENSVNLELAFGKATVSGHLPNKDGLHVQFELTNRDGLPAPFDIGHFRLTTQVVLSGYAGAKAATSVNM